jgi:hypothetical protein
MLEREEDVAQVSTIKQRAGSPAAARFGRIDCGKKLGKGG